MPSDWSEADRTRQRKVTVSVDDSVVAGQILGQSSDTKFEADVSPVRNNTAYCPVDFFDSSLAAAMTNILATLISDWEDYKSDSGIYNEASMYRTACRLSLIHI